MLSSDITTLINALDKLNASASFAYKYGPFFFAVALLILTPFIALAIFKRIIGRTSTGRHYQNAYDDFRFYFRATVSAGLVCVAIGVAWWIFDNYRQVERTQQLVTDLARQIGELQTALSAKKYAVVGVITEGVNESDEFVPTFSGQQQTIVFSRVPPTNNLFFVVLSDDEIPPKLDTIVSWNQYDQSANIRTRPVSLRIQMTLNQEGFGQYHLQFDPHAIGALIIPTR